MLPRTFSYLLPKSRFASVSNRRPVVSKPLRGLRVNWTNRHINSSSVTRNSTLFPLNYSTKNSAPTVYMHLDSGNHKLAIPLPSGERVFSLKEHLNVSSFIEDVLAEDPAVKSVTVHDKHGHVSRGTPVEALLKDDWEVKINGSQFAIKSPPRSLIGGHYASVHPDQVKSDVNLSAVKSYLESQSQEAKTVINLDDFIQFAEDKGISKEVALSHLRTLHKLGAVIFLEDNVELSNKILLNPKRVANAIEKALSIPKLRESTKAALESQLEALTARLGELQGAYETIDTKASRSSNIIAYSVLGGLLFQWLLFARFTWWDYSWDVMEPVTYFVMTAELSLGGYVYYLWQGSEYANFDMWSTLYNWRFKSIARRRGFDIEEWNAVNNGIISTQDQIAHYQD